MDAEGPADVLADREEPDVIDDGLAAAAVLSRVAGASHHEGGCVPRPQPVEQRLQFRPLGRLDHVVGIEPEREIAGGPRQRGIARRGEVVDPDEVEHPGAELAGDLDRPVDAARIDDDDLIEDPPHRSRQCGRLFSSSLTIMVRVTLGLRRSRSEDSCPQMDADEHR